MSGLIHNFLPTDWGGGWGLGLGWAAGLPINTLCSTILLFQRRRDVGIDPKGPEGVIEIKDEDLGQGQAIGKGFGGICRLNGWFLFGLLDHDE